MGIVVKDLSFSYPGTTTCAIEHLNLKIEKGERVAIIGQNGAGKSTAVKVINNIYKPSRGSVTIDGIETKGKTTAQIAPHIGYVFQNPNDQIFNDNVIKEIEYVLRYNKLPEAEILQRRNNAIKITGIEPFIDTHPFDIPLPLRKFLTIASVLAVDPDYIILDEPTAGQDNWGRKQLQSIIDHLQSQGKAIITISHDMEFVAENFGRTIVMAHKNIIADGETRDIFYQKEILEEAKVRPPVCASIAQKIDLNKKVLSLPELAQAYQQKGCII